MSGRYAIDASVWNRLHRPGVASRVRALVEEGIVSISDQARLEILFSARDGDEHAAMTRELSTLPTTPGGHRVWRRALHVQGLLATQGGLHHRSVKIPDLLVAASAEAAGDTVLHYDEDFDHIAAVTGQPTEWVVPRGTA
ncbi:MAG: PIN domain nuclease [Acidimicrobiia bacterium]